jgi:hypothetical protein
MNFAFIFLSYLNEIGGNLKDGLRIVLPRGVSISPRTDPDGTRVSGE